MGVRRIMTLSERAAKIAVMSRRAGNSESVALAALAAFCAQKNPQLVRLGLDAIEDAIRSRILVNDPVIADPVVDIPMTDSAEADFIARRGERLQ